MTERKPPQMSFRSWIDQQIADAEKRGVFDDLPGAGKPLNIRPSDPGGDYGAAWVRDYARREGVPPRSSCRPRCGCAGRRRRSRRRWPASAPSGRCARRPPS